MQQAKNRHPLLLVGGWCCGEAIFEPTQRISFWWNSTHFVNIGWWFNLLGIKDLTLYWRRFIDDVLNFFQGCEKQAERYFEKLNALYPGQVHFTWECSNSKGIFLNIEIFKNENLKIFETKYFVKPSNKRLFLHYRSNHPQHTFKSIVYSQA